MRISAKLSTVAAAAALGVAPALALGHDHPTGPPGNTPTGTAMTTTTPGNGGANPHKCKPHEVGYIAGGAVVSWSATHNVDGTWNGPFTIHVTRANHRANSDKNSDVTYTLDNTKLHFSKGAMPPPAAADAVQVIGKITQLAKRCDQIGFTPTVTVGQVVVHTPPAPESSS
jgi:hypothetical protein